MKKEKDSQQEQTEETEKEREIRRFSFRTPLSPFPPVKKLNGRLPKAQGLESKPEPLRSLRPPVQGVFLEMKDEKRFSTGANRANGEQGREFQKFSFRSPLSPFPPVKSLSLL